VRKENSTVHLVRLVISGLLATQATQAAAPDPAQIDSFVEQNLQRWETPGLSLAIVKDDEVVRASGFGVRETGQPAPVDGDTLVGIGSTSKAFGAAGIARLMQQGKLSYDDRVQDHLPWFRIGDSWVSHEARIRDILAHRTGMDISDENRLLAVATDSRDFVRRLRYLEPAQPFRANYLYSNAMFTTAGLVIEAASGKTWDAYLRDEIWTPLGMGRTHASLDRALADANHATPYVKVQQRLRPLPQWQPERNIFEVTGPSGAVISSARDMAQWLRLQLGEGSLGGREIIARDIFRQMHTPHSPMRDVQGATSWFRHIPAADLHIGSQAYALGWRISSFRGHPMIWHGGTVSSFRTVVAFMPEQKVAVFVNGSRESLLPFAVALTVFDEYLQTRDQDWSELFLREQSLQDADEAADILKTDAARTRGTRPSLPLAKYAGDFDDRAGYGAISVTAAKAGLTLTLGKLVGDLEHWHYDVFRVHWRTPAPSSSFATFMIAPTGKVQRLDLEERGRFERIER
jgi:CubicO group peptidase (beta-lactamase class C family)